MSPCASRMRKVGIALTVLAILQKPRKNRKAWAKKLYLERPKFSHLQLLEVLDSMDIKKYLRMSDTLFQELLGLLRPYIEKENTVMRDAISLAERLMVTLRVLATGRKCSDMKFSSAISPQALSSVIPETCEAIFKCLKGFIKMPSTEAQWEAVAADFQEKWNFNHCVGAMDGKHVAIKKPSGSGSQFFNYKKFFSIILFALVDANYKFMFVHTGTNGSARDSTVLQSTKFYEKLMNGSLNLSRDRESPGTTTTVPHVFLRDSAFSLNKHIMKPFPMREISHDHRIFNYRLSRARRVVENAFGILSSRFQIFQTTISFKLSTVDIVVLACCALHNFLATRNPCYLTDGDMLDCEDTRNSAFREGDWRQWAMVPLSQKSVRERYEEGNSVRHLFVDYFNNEGKVSFQEDMLRKIRS